MAWIQKNNIPIPKKIPFSLNNFNGGLNNKSSDTMLQDNQASDLLNMAFSEDGLMEKRHGVEQMLNTPLDKPITFLDVYTPINSKPELLVGTNQELYKGTRTSIDIVKQGKDMFDEGEYDGLILNNNKLYLDSVVLNIEDGIEESNIYELNNDGAEDFTLTFNVQGIDTL